MLNVYSLNKSVVIKSIKFVHSVSLKLIKISARCVDNQTLIIYR